MLTIVQMLRHLKGIFYWLRMKLKCITPLKKEEIRRSSVLSTQSVESTWKVAVSTWPTDTNTHLAFLKELKPHNIQKEWGWEYSFTFLFFVFFWQMTPWQLEKKMLGSLNRFLSYKNKMCWIRQRQTSYILLLNPNESHPTPTPSVPWLLLLVFFSLSRNVIY